MTTIKDRPLLFKPKRQSLGHSPSRSKASDDILLHITPSTVLDALTSQTGAFRPCMALASPAQRDFAVRTALASQRIHEWLTEMHAWQWPRQAAFDPLTSSTDSKSEHDYMGSLLQRQVSEYACRIQDIYQAIDQLELEDIKSHIITNHILPLSRSTTPLSEAGHDSAPAPSYNRMDDLSAIVTAIIMQALPNMARLTRLLQIWTMRITVLQHVRPVLGAIEDAEEVMIRAWEQVSLLEQEKARFENDQAGEPLQGVLNKETFGPRKRYIMRKVAKPGRTLDYMLDCLEGMDDTLPDHWLERMEVVEKDYCEWAVVTERKIREIDWLCSILAGQDQDAIRWRDESAAPDSDSLVDVSMLHIEDNLADKVASRHTKSPHLATDKPPSLSALGLVDGFASGAASEVVTEAETPPKQRRSVSDEAAYSAMSPVTEEVDEEEEPCLPELPDNDMAEVGELADDTVLYGSHFDGMSSDGPEISLSPTAFKGPARAAEFLDDDTPPSSPPVSPPSSADDQMRTSDVNFGDSPVAHAVQRKFDDSVQETKIPLGNSLMDDDNDACSLPNLAPCTLAAGGESAGDEKLHNQISQIIEGIPANIHLQSNTPAINLNPPDLQLPHLKKKPSKDRFRRSGSAVSSRTTTPSFTLSPAKFSRPTRPQRGQQEIKVYHLSRSTGEAPIKLFIRCVGQDGERVMVRVGGGWADLSEYLKDYASHHGRRSGKSEETAVEVRDVPQVGRAMGSGLGGSLGIGSSPVSRPVSRMGDGSTMTTTYSAAATTPSTPLLHVRKTRRSPAPNMGNESGRLLGARTPAAVASSSRHPPSLLGDVATPGSDGGVGSAARSSRPNSRMGWVEDDSSFLGLAGPSGKKVEMSDESRAWIESVKEKVRVASGERKLAAMTEPSAASTTSGNNDNRARSTTPAATEDKKRLGELGRVGGTKRLFRKSVTRRPSLGGT